MRLVRHRLIVVVIALLQFSACAVHKSETGSAPVSANAQETNRVFLVGDSTIAKKIAERAPETGWGMALADLAKPQLVVENHAVNGRSSKSFHKEGRWQVVLDQLRPGDHLVIQFGHNDQKITDPERYAAPRGEYTDMLTRFVEQARAKGASPILATPIYRREFNEQGELQATHGDYPDAMRDLARRLDVPLVDLQEATRQSLQALGPGPSSSLYLHVKPGEYAYYKDGKIDNTHLSPKGALWVARLFIEQLREQEHPLAEHFYADRPRSHTRLEAIKLWTQMPPVAAQLPGNEQTEDGRVSNVRSPEIIPYLASPAMANGAGVLVFPGGGYHRLAIDKEGVAVAEWLNAHGIHAFIVKYRMREFGAPAPLLDAQQAMRLVRARAEEWRLHPNKIGVVGFSAGGHVAASLLTHFAYWPEELEPGGLKDVSARPDFGMLIYPVVTMREPYTHRGSRAALLGEAPNEAFLSFYSLEEQAHAAMPPVFMVHGGNDDSVPVQNSLAFYSALHQSGVPAELLLYRNAPHGIGLLPGYQQASAWPARASEWLKSIRIITE